MQQGMTTPANELAELRADLSPSALFHWQVAFRIVPIDGKVVSSNASQGVFERAVLLLGPPCWYDVDGDVRAQRIAAVFALHEEHGLLCAQPRELCLMPYVRPRGKHTHELPEIVQLTLEQQWPTLADDLLASRMAKNAPPRERFTGIALSDAASMPSLFSRIDSEWQSVMVAWLAAHRDELTELGSGEAEVAATRAAIDEVGRRRRIDLLSLLEQMEMLDEAVVRMTLVQPALPHVQPMTLGLINALLDATLEQLRESVYDERSRVATLTCLRAKSLGRMGSAPDTHG